LIVALIAIGMLTIGCDKKGDDKGAGAKKRTVAIDCANPGPNPVDEGLPIQCTVTATRGAPQPDAATDTCGGTLAGGVYSYAPGEADGPGNCIAAVELTENTSIKAQDIVTINEVNQAPYWTTEPADVAIRVNDIYNQTNGVAADDDLPNVNPGDPGYLTCGTASNSCSFLVSVTGFGAATCNMSFTAGPSPETCAVQVEVSDGYAGSVTQSVTITVIPGIWHVDAYATGAETGLSWANAFTVIQDAVDAATSGQMVWVAEGIYRNSSGVATKEVLLMKEGVEIYGGFAGTENDLAERGNPADHPTILDGNGTSNQVVIGATNSRLDGFITINGNAVGVGDGGGMLNSGVTGLTVANCNFFSNYAANAGGGMFNENSDVTVNNSTFSQNVAEIDGGGIINTSSSSLMISDSTLSNNTAAVGSGGGIFNVNSDVVISNSTFRGNDAGYGGGLSNVDSDATITNSSFRNNNALEYSYCYGYYYYGCVDYGGYGGGMHNLYSSLFISDGIFSSNFASISGGGMFNENSFPIITNGTFRDNYVFRYGAGMNNMESSLWIRNSVFTGNRAFYDGGGINNISSWLITENSLFTHNVTRGDGGGLRNLSSDLTLSNCLVAHNVAEWGYGGGIYNYRDYEVAISNSTFAYNYSYRQGGAIASNGWYFYNPYLYISDSILWGNSTYTGAYTEIFNWWSHYPIHTVIYSDIMGGYPGVGNIDLDPLFVTTDEFHLSQTAAGQGADSPCVDAGSNTAANRGMDTKATRTDGVPDSGIVDMGFHH